MIINLLASFSSLPRKLQGPAIAMLSIALVALVVTVQIRHPFLRLPFRPFLGMAAVGE